MKSSIPWSIKGIEPEAREAAKSAARRSGMTLGQWLNSVILDTDGDDYEEEQHYRYPARSTSARREPKRSEHDIQDRLDELSQQISGLARRQSETAVSRIVQPQVDLEPVTDAVRELVHRVERSERRSVETLETFDERLSRMSEKFASEFEKRKNGKSQQQDESHQAFEKTLTDIVDHIEQTDRRTGESIKAIQARLEEFRNPAPAAEPEKNAEPDREFVRLERQLAEMAARLERAERRNADAAKQKAADQRALEAAMQQHRAQQVDPSKFVSRDDLQNIQARIQDIVNRLDDTNFAATNSTIVSMQEEISLLSSSLAEQRHESASAAEVDGLKQTIDNVAAQLQGIANFSGDPEQAIKRIEEEITGLSQSVADLSIEAASSKELMALRENFDRIAQQVETQQGLISQSDPDAVMQMRAELSSFNDTIAQIRNDTASFGDVQALRDTVEHLAAQLAQAGHSGTDGAAYMALEHRLNDIAQRLDQTGGDGIPLQDLSEIEGRIKEVETRIESVGAVDGNAEGMNVLQGELVRMSERLAQIEQVGIPQNSEDGAIHAATTNAITALERGLQSVQENAERADRRTQETLEAVHETLEKVVLRLARLEDGQVAAPEAAPEAPIGTPPMMADKGMALEPQAPELPPMPEPAGVPAPEVAPMEVSDLPLAGKPAIDIQLPPIVGLEEQPAQPSTEPAAADTAPDSHDTIPDLRLDPIDVPQDLMPEPLAPMPQEPAPQAPAEDFIAAARRAAQASADAAPAEEKPSRSRLNLLGPRSPEEAEKAGKKGSKKKTILLAAAVALLAIGALSTMSLVKNKRAALAPAPQSSEVFTAPKPSAPNAATPGAAVPSTSNKESRTTMPAPQAQHVDRPINPQSVPAAATNKADRAMQVYQQIQEARKRRQAVTNAPSAPAKDIPVAVPLSDPDITGSVSNQATAADPNAISGIAGADSRNSLLTADSPAGTPATTAAATRGGGFASVTESLPPAEIGPMSLRVAAATGNPNAQFEIASRYTEGKIISQDLRRAATWYQKAAAKGLAPAQYRLGTLYEKGRGVPADKAAARIWYERAAEKGNRKAMHNLAVIYADTSGENHDFAKAAYWFRNAAELGLTDSQYNYGILNERGLGVRANAAEAYKWFAIGASNGDKESANRMALVEKKLSPEVLIRAKLEVENWEPRDPVQEANMVPVPEGGWGATKARTSSAGDARTSIARAQSLLNDMGYHAGPADGVLGPRTREAIRAFQRDKGLTATGMVTKDLLAQLAEQPG